MKQTRLLTLSALLAAGGVALIYLTAVMPTLQFALVAIAGLLPAIPLLLGGMKWGLLTYAATGLLALILGIDKEAAILYLLLFGHWPMVKSLIERKLRHRALEWIAKLLVCNLLFLALYLMVKLIGIDIGDLGMPLWLFWLVGDLSFVLYDVCFTLLIGTFGARLRRLVERSRKN